MEVRRERLGSKEVSWILVVVLDSWACSFLWFEKKKKKKVDGLVCRSREVQRDSFRRVEWRKWLVVLCERGNIYRLFK